MKAGQCELPPMGPRESPGRGLWDLQKCKIWKDKLTSYAKPKKQQLNK